MPLILLIGGADTGRAPLAAVLLRRRLYATDGAWQVESAGVLGHDGAAMQPEAQVALEHLGATPPSHVARSLTDELANAADLLLTVDRGTALVLTGRYPAAPVAALPDLARISHDIPDPYRMTLDAWIVYGRELDQQLAAALPAIVERCGSTPSASLNHPAPPDSAPDHLTVLIECMQRAPQIIDWSRGRAAVRAALQTISAADPSDLRPAAVAMLTGLLSASAEPLNPAQLAVLRDVATLIQQPLDAVGLSQLGAAVGRWHETRKE